MPYPHGRVEGSLTDVWLGPLSPVSQTAHVAGPASATYQTANRAFYYPVRVARPLIVYQAFWDNGTAVSGNIDVGLYDRVGTRLVSTGSTAQAGISSRQTVDITDTLIGSGIFYVAVAMDNTTGTLFQRTENTPHMRLMGVFTQESAFALPANATFTTAAGGRIVVVWLACRPVI